MQRVDLRALSGYNCGVCSKRTRVIGTNDLATTDPDLVAEWHPYKNWKTPTEVTSIDAHFWWTCSAGHEYQQTVAHRRKSEGCPMCPAHERALAA